METIDVREYARSGGEILYVRPNGTIAHRTRDYVLHILPGAALLRMEYKSHLEFNWHYEDNPRKVWSKLISADGTHWDVELHTAEGSALIIPERLCRKIAKHGMTGPRESITSTPLVVKEA